MSRFIHLSKKKKLAKHARMTRWAPFWVVPKINGAGRRLHPGRHTSVKRSWRRIKIKI